MAILPMLRRPLAPPAMRRRPEAMARHAQAPVAAPSADGFSPRTFRRIADLIETRTGIKMPNGRTGEVAWENWTVV